VLDGFGVAAGQLAESNQTLQEESAGIKREIEDVLVALQFQDRVGQILAHVRNDLEKLHAQVCLSGEHYARGEACAPVDTEAWLEELAIAYSTDEQRANHSGAAVESGKTSEITFF
jgi:methyl-accepting chemotaxis protein